MHFSTEERMTACQTALPNSHVMKRSPPDRSSRQAASAVVFCHWNDRFLDLQSYISNIPTVWPTVMAQHCKWEFVPQKQTKKNLFALQPALQILSEKSSYKAKTFRLYLRD